MKSCLTLLFLLTAALLMADDAQYMIQVTQNLVTQRVDYTARKTVDTMAQKEALKRYITRLAPQIPENLIEKAMDEYTQFIDRVEKIQERFTQLGGDGSGELSVDYKIYILHKNVHNFLKENGFSISSGMEITVLEEPPALGQIQLHTAFGSDSEYFISNYVTLQRRVMDAIVKKISDFGFDVKLLADNPLYRPYLTKDRTLSGVYYDVETKQFCRNNDLLNVVKQNNPDTIVLCYRFDALIFDPARNAVRTTIAFSMKDLKNDFSKPLGSSYFEVIVSSNSKPAIMDEIVFCAETAVATLLNKEDAADKLTKTAMSLRNSRLVKKGPLKIIINTDAFDKKNRKKLMYCLRKQLIERKITSPAMLEVSNTTITARVTNPQITAADELYMEHIVPILKEFGEDLDDSRVNYDNNTLTIKP